MEYPNHFVCLQQVNENQWIIVFRRNNLSKQLFEYNAYENTYSYTEQYQDGFCNISYSLIINSSTFYDLFCSECKYFSAKGGTNSFGISIKTKPIKFNEIISQKINKSISEETEFVTYRCTFKGFYNSYILFDKKWNKVNKTVSINNGKNLKMKSKSKPKPRNQTIKEIPYEKVENAKTKIDYNIVKKCSYFKNSICSYFDNVCNPYSIKCINRGILTLLNKKDSLKSQERVNSNKQHKQSISQRSKYVKAVVLSHNRKCINDKHDITDVSAKFKVLINNEITETSILAGYCKECDQYIILKSDFKKAKQKGTLLCQVIDKTPEYLSKHEGSYTSTESRVHSLGYNVIKQRYNYTFEQRKIILANIIENYEITQHEILSMLDTNIARKINLPSYADAVEKWQQDREFVTNYKTGDIPEVLIDEIIVGKRK